MSEPPGLLFSTFEPSGDALAATAIAGLRRLEPGLKVYALGGPKMEAAGAQIIEQTTECGAMGLDTLRQVWSHRRRLRRLRGWLDHHRIDVFVPVDSPAGNWSICKVVRRVQPPAKIVHLVAPQVWAWASWRVRRLRRLTDHVLCLLPFEPEWLAARGVRATFVGHPIFDDSRRFPSQPIEASPNAGLRLALLPGSRTSEVSRNWPTMLTAFWQLRREHHDLRGTVAALDRRIEQLVRRMTAQTRPDGEWPECLTLVTDRTEAVLDWCDLALVVSGTVTLQVAARGKPMVIMYNVPRLLVLLLGWMVKTGTFTLPNLVSEWAGLGRAVPELAPHFGQVEPVVRQLETLITSQEVVRQQLAALAEVVARFNEQRFIDEAPRQLLAALNGGEGTEGGCGGIK
ncbi:MAG: lipid-A-disaccharide synthase [Planctomycetota bacterium]|jgi:lipid-A-disaccharide synthase